jgi:putative transposase
VGLDFVRDSLANGRALRLLTVVDTVTRESLALEVATSLPGTRGAAVLERRAGLRGTPREIVLDNGPELTSAAMDRWASGRGVRPRFIAPGRPVQHAFAESFNGRPRDECLNEHWITTLAEARDIIAEWRDDYNHTRPHGALGYRAPAAVAAGGMPPAINPPRAEALS